MIKWKFQYDNFAVTVNFDEKTPEADTAITELLASNEQTNFNRFLATPLNEREMCFFNLAHVRLATREVVADVTLEVSDDPEVEMLSNEDLKDTYAEMPSI